MGLWKCKKVPHIVLLLLAVLYFNQVSSVRASSALIGLWVWENGNEYWDISESKVDRLIEYRDQEGWTVPIIDTFPLRFYEKKVQGTGKSKKIAELNGFPFSGAWSESAIDIGGKFELVKANKTQIQEWRNIQAFLKDKTSTNILIEAVKNNDFDSAEKAIQKGAWVNAFKKGVGSPDRLALSIIKPDTEDIKVMKLLVISGAKRVNLDDAARSENLHVFEFILERTSKKSRSFRELSHYLTHGTEEISLSFFNALPESERRYDEKIARKTISLGYFSVFKKIIELGPGTPKQIVGNIQLAARENRQVFAQLLAQKLETTNRVHPKYLERTIQLARQRQWGDVVSALRKDECCGAAKSSAVNHETSLSEKEGDCISSIPKHDYADSLRNLTIDGTASQSSTGNWGWEAVPGLAVDGNRDGNYMGHSVTHTLQETGAWWQVDLGNAHAIQKIVIWNRTDGGWGKRLTDFNLVVSDSSNRVVFEKTYCKEGKFFNPAMIVEVPIDIKGQFVKIMLNGNNYLSLAEVELFSRN